MLKLMAAKHFDGVALVQQSRATMVEWMSLAIFVYQDGQDVYQVPLSQKRNPWQQLRLYLARKAVCLEIS